MTVTVENAVAPEFHWLAPHASRRHSQTGEDGLIAAVLSVIGATSQWSFECGAGDGITFSNTLALCEKGWHGVFVERNKRLFREMERRHNSPGARRMGLDKRSHRVRAELQPTGEFSPEGILERLVAPAQIDLMSIDIDGGEEQILVGLTWLRPRVLCVEYVHVLAVHIDSLHAEVERIGYVPVAMTNCNLICVPIEIVTPLSKPQES